MSGALSDVVSSIYEAALDGGRWPAALQAIADCFDDVGTVLMFASADGSMGTIVSPHLEKAQRSYDEKWYSLDIRATRSIEKGYHLKSEAVTDSDVTSDWETKHHPIYTGFLRDHGLGWFAGVSVLPHPSKPVFISVQRKKSKERFTDAELSLLTQIARHVETALKVGMRMIEVENRALNLLQLLSLVEYGAVVVDEDSNIVASNRKADLVLSASLRRKLLKLIRSNGNQSDPDSDSSGNCLLSTQRLSKPIILHCDDGKSLIVYSTPIAIAADRMPYSSLSGKGNLVLIVDPSRTSSPDPAIVRDILGLTLSEAKVASLIGSGSAPRIVAQKLGISVETVRSCLKTIFMKTGVSRQSELVALFGKLQLK